MPTKVNNKPGNKLSQILRLDRIKGSKVSFQVTKATLSLTPVLLEGQMTKKRTKMVSL